MLRRRWNQIHETSQAFSANHFLSGSLRIGRERGVLHLVWSFVANSRHCGGRLFVRTPERRSTATAMIGGDDNITQNVDWNERGRERDKDEGRGRMQRYSVGHSLRKGLYCVSSPQSRCFVKHFWHVPPAVGLILQLLCSSVGNKNFWQKTNQNIASDWGGETESKCLFLVCS